jgi:uncharacterized protein (TIRG00374 family)
MMVGEEEVTQEEDSFISTGRLVAFVLIGMVIYLLMAIVDQWDQVIATIAGIEWWWIVPTMMGLSFLNYLIRYGKWQYYLRRIGVNISHTDSFSIFLAGFTLTVTPGKIGEAIKGYFCREVDGSPIAKTVPVVISERVTDLLAMVIISVLSFAAILTSGNQLLLVLFAGALVLVGALVLTNSKFYNRILKKLTTFGPLKRFEESIDQVEDTMVRTLSPKPMIIGTLVSVPGWFMECLELWLLLSIVTGAGLPAFTSTSLFLLAQATFVHASASAVGAILVFLPGGLGGYEIYARSVLTTFGILAAVATASVFLIRFVTLWFSVIVGFVALAFVTRRNRERECQTQQA